MTFCCGHTKKAYELTDRARDILDWNNDLGIGDAIGGALTLNTWSVARFGENLKTAEKRMSEARNLLNDVKREIEACKCAEQTMRVGSKLKRLQEENLEQNLEREKERLNRLTRRLKVNKEEVRKLSDAHENLFREEENGGKDEIREARKNVEIIEDNFSSTLKIDTDDLQTIYDLCKKTAKLQVQKEQEFVAQIEVPLHRPPTQ